MKIGDFEQALTYAIQSYKYGEENKSAILQKRFGFEVYANSFKNLMDVLINKRNYQEALNTGMKLLDALREENIPIDDYDEYYAIIRSIGLSYSGLGQYEEALTYFNEALKVGVATAREEVFYGKLLFSIGLCYVNLDQPEKALDYYNNGLKLLKKTYTCSFN